MNMKQTKCERVKKAPKFLRVMTR